MSFDSAPELPEFISRKYAFDRHVYTLGKGLHQGRRVHFVDHGEKTGQPVLLLHGNPTWSYLWRKVISLLPFDRFRCIAPDLLGFGLSDKLPEVSDHSLVGHVEAVAELVTRLDLKDFILVGQDWGGPVITSVGARLQNQAAGVVLANTAVVLPARPRGTTFHRLSRLPLMSDLLFRVFGFPLWALHRAQGDRGSMEGDVRRAYWWPLRRLRDRAGPLAMARMVPDNLEHPSIPELRRGEQWLKEFQGPLKLVWGERDPILGRALRRHLREFPHASVTKTQAGHFLQEEVPESLAAAIQAVADSRL